MKITANRLTLLRILLLPVPCLLLYGGPEAKITALGVGSLLGLTDYFDGRLARRHGVTRLGTLLDPIADKIFVAVIYLVLTRLGYLSLFLVAGILLREFLVTALRQLVPGNLPVSWLAKTKTALQMAGAALIILLKTFPGYTLALLLATSLLAGVGVFFSSLKSSQKRALLLATLGFPLLALVPGEKLPSLLGGLVLLVTWLSAAGYLRAAAKSLSSRALPDLVSRLALPTVALFLIPLAGPWWPLALFLLISELVREALALLTQKTAPPRLWGVLGLLGVGPLLLGGPQVTVAYLSLALIASLCEAGKLLVDFWQAARG